MKTLFVGGPKDGKREVWPNSLSAAAQVYSHRLYPDSATTFDRDKAIVGMNIDTYQLKQFTGADYPVAFHSSVKYPMEALIKGYRYHRNPRYGRSRRV
jgi:hypothetical protein